MKKVFIKETQKGINQIKVIDMEQGTFTTYNQDQTIGFTFGNPFTQDVVKMGYKDVKDCIKKLKSRGLLGVEKGYDEQLRSEKIGLINLGVDRIKRANRINTSDFTDVIEKLKSYGLGFVDAQNTIIASYLHREEV